MKNKNAFSPHMLGNYVVKTSDYSCLQKFIEDEITNFIYEYRLYWLNDINEFFQFGYIPPKFDSDLVPHSALLGNSGSGKTLLLIKLFLEQANFCLAKISNNTFDPKTDAIPIFLYAKTLTLDEFYDINKIYQKVFKKNIQDIDINAYKFDIYLDGLDEVNISFTKIDTELSKRIVFLTCRKHIFNNLYAFIFNGFHSITIKPWNNDDIRNFIEKYLNSTAEPKTKLKDKLFLYLESRKDKSISPLILTLLLTVVCSENTESILNDCGQIMVTKVIDTALSIIFNREFVARGIYPNYDNCTLAKDIIKDAFWLYKVKKVTAKREIIQKCMNNQEYYNELIDKNTVNNIILTTINLFFKEEENSSTPATFLFHAMFGEFFLSKHLHKIISNNLNNNDVKHFPVKSQIMIFLDELTDNQPQYSAEWIFSTLKDISNISFSMYSLCILLLSRHFYDKITKEYLMALLTDNTTTTSHKLLIYEQLLMHTENLAFKLQIEGAFFNILKNDNSAIINYIVMRMSYSDDIDFDDNKFSHDYYSWKFLSLQFNNLFDNIKNHLSETAENSRHHYLNRIDLLILWMFIQNSNEMPLEIKANIINFIMAIKNRIITQKSHSEFNTLVYEMYNTYFNNIHQY